MARIAKCGCPTCNAEGVVSIPCMDRGGRSVFLCERHARHLERYGFKNNCHLGTRKANGFTLGMELETMRPDVYARGNLCNLGFVPTSDCTVDVEFKSSIYEGLNAIMKQCVSIEMLKNEGHITIDHNCGTHLHIGHHTHINEMTMDYVVRFYHSLFVPLSDLMKQYPEETTAFWGRSFTGGQTWAIPVYFGCEPKNHTNFINVQHPNTIEFRLCFFRNAEQYQNVVKFCKDAVNAVINNFIVHFNDTVDGDITAYRTHKAQVTANKICKLYREYINV